MRSRPHPRGRIKALAGVALAGLLIPLGASCTAPPPPPPPPGPQARGIDVSNYQHPNGAPINWGAVRGSGVEFAFIKATEGPVGCDGSYYTNNWFRRDWAESAGAGLYRGAYHFARPGDVGSAISQARYFVDTVGHMNGPRDLPPVLDIESSCGLDAPALAAFAHAWIGEVQRLTGRTPILYTYYYFWRDQVRSEPTLGHLPLWIATYGPQPMVPLPWRGWSFWQHSSTGSVPGIIGNVDLNLFAWDIATLARYVVEGASNPKGSFDMAAGGAGSVSVGGWALDLDDPAPIEVHAYVAGRGFALQARDNRPDVGAIYPVSGPAHGFNGQLSDIPAGRHEVCLDAINAGPGVNVRIGCKTVDVAAVEPFGSVDMVSGGSGRIDVAGWAVDPDTTLPVPVHVYVDGAMRAGANANGPRHDVAAAFPGFGPDHGFGLGVTGIAPGPHNVCVYALNTAGPGHNQLLACRPTIVA